MAIHTAKVLFYNKSRNYFEQVWFDSIRAKNEQTAYGKAAVKANQYLIGQKNNPTAPNGFLILFCVLSSTLNTKTGMNKAADLEIQALRSLDRPVKAKAISTILAGSIVPPDKKEETPPAPKVDESIYEEEVRGTFADALDFKKEISVRVFTPYTTEYSGWGFGRRY